MLNLNNFKVPKVISPQSYRMFVISTFIYYLCLAIHAGLLVLFYAIKVYPMAIFNIGSVSIFILAVLLNYKGKLLLAYNIAVTEIMVHAILATIFIGWSSNFPVYLIALIVFNVFCSPSSVRKGMIANVFYALITTAVYIYCTMFNPIYKLDKVVLTVVGAVNFFSICLVIIIACYFYYKTTEKLKVDFNLSEKIANKQKRLIDAILINVNKLEETSCNITTNIKSTTNSIRKISDSLQDINSCTTESVAVAEEIVSNTVEAFEHSLTISDKSTDMKSESENVLDVAKEGERFIDEARASIIKVEANSTDIFNNAKDLKISSKKIEKIGSMITNISSEIRLLALNASIESVKAGDSGSSNGFYVISQEVRKLSDKTKSFSNDIISIITDVSNEVDNLLLQCEQNIEYVNDSVSKTLDANNKFKYVLNSITSMVGEIKSVTDASEKQTLITKEIETGIQQSAKSSLNIAKTVEEIHIYTKDQVELFNEIEVVSCELLKMSEELKNITSSI